MARISGKVRTLQWVDAFLVSPICFLLTRWRQLIELFSSKKTNPAPRSFLIIKLAEQGSTVLAHEAIKQCCERVGRENVYFLLFEENRFILDLLNLLPKENIIEIKTRSSLAMATSALKELRKIRRLKIDACIDMEFFSRSTAVLAYLSGAPIRSGFHAPWGSGPYRGNLFSRPLLYNPHMHASQSFLSLVHAVDNPPKTFPQSPIILPPLPPPPLFVSSDEEKTEVAKLLEHLLGTEPRKLILLNANASDMLPLRRWESENYVKLAQRVLEKFPECRIAFTGSAEESEKIQHLVSTLNSSRCVSLAGKTTLRQLLVIYGMSSILVTNDSGPAHFSGLTNIPTIVLFGPETPLLFGSLSPRHRNLRAGVSCSPCISAWNQRRTPCKNNLCMQYISVDTVFETLCELYQQKTPQN